MTFLAVLLLVNPIMRSKFPYSSAQLLHFLDLLMCEPLHASIAEPTQPGSLLMLPSGLQVLWSCPSCCVMMPTSLS